MGSRAIETRDEIIAEIRRLAFEFGRPPGAWLFETETGMPAHRWRGLYWARWSDAVRDAGLEPNPPSLKTDTDVMLEQLAVATRAFGHFPGTAELALYRRTRRIAGHNTLRRHLGGRAALISRLRAWTAGRPEYADVAALLAPEARRPAPDDECKKSPGPATNP